MTSIESVLKSSAYTRFCIGVRVMQEVLAAAPGPVSARELQCSVRCSAWLLAQVCSRLARAGMLSPVAGIAESWLPGPLADSVTLADILCCEVTHPAGRQKTLQGGHASRGCRPDMDAFVMQATMEINQIVLAQLRRFPLRRPGGHAIAGSNV
jgi:DNA-binding IscR family transcriptional regulator